MTDEDSGVIRIDRVATWDRFGFWKHVPQGPLYGDLVLAEDYVRFVGVGMLGERWRVSRSAIVGVRQCSDSDSDPVSRILAKPLPGRMRQASQASLIADWGGKSRAIRFTGYVNFTGTGENLISHIPGVQHAGAYVVGVKKAWDNRGAAARAIEAYQAWMDELGSTPKALAHVPIETTPTVSEGPPYHHGACTIHHRTPETAQGCSRH